MKYIKTFNTQAEALNTIQETPFVGTIYGRSKTMFASILDYGLYIRIVKDDDFIKPDDIGYLIPNNEIWYTTTDGNPITPSNPDLIKNGSDSLTVVNNIYDERINMFRLIMSDEITSLSQSGDSGTTSKGVFYKQYLNNSTLRTIKLPDTVTNIGCGTFLNCNALTDAHLGYGVVNIYAHCFNGCTALNNVYIPSTVTYIGTRAFYYCMQLKNVSLVNTSLSLGIGCFSDCSLLKSADFPLINIPSAVFYNCKKLTTINFKGTKTEWITKYNSAGTNAFGSVPTTCIVNCSDGSVYLNGSAIS